jgi:DNA-binding LacI/PurR family transcriptional regulator
MRGSFQLAEKITLSTIAEGLGISTATVSLALRDSPLVAETTREKIKARAAEVGYIYNRRAAALRTSRSDIVGVIVRDIINPFFAEILRSIEEELGNNRQTFLLCNHEDDLELQSNFISTLMQFGADGVIMSPSIGTSKEDIELIEANGLPVTMVARSVEGANVPTFLGDDRAGFELITAYLIGLGHRNIAIIGGTRKTSTGRDRRAGYLAAFKKADIDPGPLIDFETLYDRKAGYEVVERILQAENRPTAIACCSDTVAIGVMNGLRQHGLEPGRDIAVTGYDNIEEAAITAPQLTTVSDGHHEIGHLAARALHARIHGDKEPGSIMHIKPELRIRQSANKRA